MLKLTAEQKDAFNRARAAVLLIKRGRNQYAVRYPWAEVDGPSTETPGAWPYIAAMQRAARLTAWQALEILGYAPDSIECALGDEYRPGAARDKFRQALFDLGPVDA